jgi:hypothetical protein
MEEETMLRSTRNPALVLSTALLISSITGCATRPEDVETGYVDPVNYRDYDCERIEESMRENAQRIALLHGRMEDEASGDAGAVAVSLILFWPAIFFVSGGNEEDVAEYKQLTAEYSALEKKAAQNDCTNTLTVESPEELIRKNESGMLAENENSSDRGGPIPEQEQDDEPAIPYDHPSRNHY